ncbi:uncharacterized protein PV09_06240 [Verruconis gallopava]|uniref:F-box domain-containing protein n=1 Tax=Verruconis gallopava TaxID=253628 RepID=A0A0D2ATF6_9PEZI|nr:uncharacterized protein PV09_06240 [Verruconis gallopava]KIW02424.1 hypothetical protein PV09_06240 [Verruconis gallopava]
MADLRGGNGPPQPPTALFHPFKNANIFRLDEGYSDDTRSQAGSEMRAESRIGDVIMDVVPDGHQPSLLLPEWIGNLNEAERSELAYALLRSLRTSSIAAIVERLNPLLHIDPVHYLPPEITFEVFSYLDPETLLLASKLSKSWRIRALDSRLWRQLYSREGWSADTRRVRQYEAELRERNRRRATGKARARTADAVSDAETKSPKKRARDEDQLACRTNSPLQWAAHRDRSDDSVEDSAPLKLEDTEMKDASPSSPTPPTPLALSHTHTGLDPPIRPSLLLSPHVDPTVNWQYLYKQKRRLEANWMMGKYKNFQLPHPSHPEEAHAECVYTIQYTRTHLVSGSRDKTLRIWNLATQRLAVPPLRGHNASVLCLQFDDRPEHDLVVSGGSDCHVILWRFSTGKMITKLERAHSESVLNLRFDERYLITCSKDKTIKIWNRKPLHPTDEAYPMRNASVSAKFPSYILDIKTMAQGDLTSVMPLREYTLLATLEGHNAAVNAIQVLGSQIVSASGDRLIKIWDIKTGQCLKTIGGHQKGIACVQFDGKRIVSGSSDETVRIFDCVTGAEVACLRGHKNLVRTVQARFGDVPGSDLDMEAEARDVDLQFFKAQIEGNLRRDRLTREQRRERNAGSRNPNEIFALGARLPPGGGGSKWARIVSGSYDESVIIWRRDAEGKWIPAHQLLQSEAVVGAGGQPRLPGGVGVIGQAQPAVPQPANAPLHVNATTTQLNFQQWLQQNGHMLSAAQVAQMQAQMAHNLQLLNQAQNGANNNAGPATPQMATNVATGPLAAPSSSTGATVAGPSTATSTSISSTTTGIQVSHANTPATQASLTQQVLQGAVNNQWLNNLPHHPHGIPPAAGAQPQAQAQAQNAAVPAPQPAIAVPAAAQPHHHHHHHHHHAANNNNNPTNALAPIQPTGANSRVFKLQFDSRRIICCSQDPTIVGWDFANGDPEIEEASIFFGEDF